jgi:hypothetical protein
MPTHGDWLKEVTLQEYKGKLQHAYDGSAAVGPEF